MKIPSSLSKLTAKELKNNRKVINDYRLFNKKYKYRALKSKYFDSQYCIRLDSYIVRILKSFPNCISWGFKDLSKEEQHLLAATIFVSEDQLEDICNRIAAPLTAFDGSCVKKEITRATLHLLAKVSPSEGGVLTFGGLLVIIRQCVDEAIAA